MYILWTVEWNGASVSYILSVSSSARPFWVCVLFFVGLFLVTVAWSMFIISSFGFSLLFLFSFVFVLILCFFTVFFDSLTIIYFF